LKAVLAHAEEEWRRLEEQRLEQERKEAERVRREEEQRKLLLLHHAVNQRKSVAEVTTIANQNRNLVTHIDSGSGQMPIHLAAARGFVELVELFAPKFCNVGVRSKTGRTALHEASFAGHVDVVRCLMQLKAATDATTSLEQTPALLAAQNGKLDVVQILVKAGCNLDLKDKDGKSASSELQAQNQDWRVAAIFAVVEKRNLDETLAQQLQRWAVGRKIGTDCSFSAPVEEVERVRKSGIGESKLNILKDTFFFAKDNKDFLLRALAYASVDVTSLKDVSKALDECEKQGPLHPLFLLACARLAKKHEDLLLQLALLREFVARAPSLKSWLSGKEQELLNMTKMPKKDEAASSSSASELELQYHELVKQIRQDYKSDASGSMLQPLEELMQMVGLDEVKQVAMSLYSDNLADKRLRGKRLCQGCTEQSAELSVCGESWDGQNGFCRAVWQDSAAVWRSRSVQVCQDDCRGGAAQGSETVCGRSGRVDGRSQRRRSSARTSAAKRNAGGSGGSKDRRKVSGQNLASGRAEERVFGGLLGRNARRVGSAKSHPGDWRKQKRGRGAVCR
jgi:hypothetical protein